ncbi:MAG TPA: hypothetical protein VM076_08935 [Gemmatimonadaceae bacterium]|nr:hypothetical protein [Gemmatimonadaceae bacterium]
MSATKLTALSMRTAVVALLGAGLAPAVLAQGAALPPAKDLIAKFVAATNAVPVMAKHQSVRTKGRFEMAAAGVAGDLEISQARPNKTIMRINLAGMGAVEQGFDGTTGWSINPMQGPRIMTGKELDAVREESSFGASSRQGPNVASAETVEKTTMNGEACYKVKMTWKSGRETNDCYSIATGLLIASVGKQESPMGSVDVTNLLSDYKEFGGQKIATRLTQQVMGQEQVITITTVDYDAADPAAFEMPAAIKALAEKKP